MCVVSIVLKYRLELKNRCWFCLIRMNIGCLCFLWNSLVCGLWVCVVMC